MREKGKRIITHHTLPIQGTLVIHKRLDEMSANEAVDYTEQLMSRLQAKQQRERAYLDHRAAHGRHTTTDDAYEADQHLESEILVVLTEVLQGLKERRISE